MSGACISRTWLDAVDGREYTAGMSRAEFEKSRMAYDATVRNLELLGEAARNVPDEVRSANSQIPWKRIVGLRNILIHGYLAIDNEIIWDIVTRWPRS